MGNTVLLKNGMRELRVGVAAVMLSLSHLIDNNPISFYEMVELCKNPEHEVFGNCINDLQALNLVTTQGTVHQTIKNVVLSGVSGESFDLVLGSPIKEDK